MSSAGVKEKLGRRPCPLCSHPLLIRRTEQGTITATCEECDLSIFAKKGTQAARQLTEGLPGAAAPRSAAPPPPAAAGKAAGKAPAAPAPAPRVTSAFSLGALGGGKP